MANQPKVTSGPGQDKPVAPADGAADQSLNTSVTEDERTEGGPVDESGDEKLNTSNDA